MKNTSVCKQSVRRVRTHTCTLLLGLHSNSVLKAIENCIKIILKVYAKCLLPIRMQKVTTDHSSSVTIENTGHIRKQKCENVAELLETRGQNEWNSRQGWALTRGSVATLLPEHVFKSEPRQMEITSLKAEGLSWGTEKPQTFKCLSGLAWESKSEGLPNTKLVLPTAWGLSELQSKERKAKQKMLVSLSWGVISELGRLRQQEFAEQISREEGAVLMACGLGGCGLGWKEGRNTFVISWGSEIKVLLDRVTRDRAQHQILETIWDLRLSKEAANSNPPQQLVYVRAYPLTRRDTFIYSVSMFFYTKHRSCNRKLWDVWWGRKMWPIIKTKK